MALVVSKYGVKVASLDQCVSSKGIERWYTVISKSIPRTEEHFGV